MFENLAQQTKEHVRPSWDGALRVMKGGARTRGPAKSMALWLALGSLAVGGWSMYKKMQREKLTQIPQAKPKPVQTWEGEGGGVKPTDLP
jgi:uncharacterized membrane protein YebE (DUF533 family)